MARVSFTAIVDEMIGKLAGSVFQYSYGGFQVHTKGKPRNPQTQYQQLRRGDFGFISASWRNLTSIQRQTFIDAAATEPEAFNLFIRSNINLILIGEAMIDTYIPSAVPDPITVEIIDASPDSYIIKATGSPTIVPAGTKALIYSTALKLPTKIFTNPSEYSPIIAFDEGTDLGVPTDIITAFQDRYGQLTADRRLCIKSVLIDKTNGSRGSDSISCINTEDMAQQYIPLFSDETDVASTGAANEVLLSYTMPANTLGNAGDRLHMLFAYNTVFRAGGNDVRVVIDSQSVFSPVHTAGENIQYRVSGWYIDASTMRLSLMWQTASGFVTVINTDITVDFTSSMDIQLVAVTNDAGSVTAKSASIDKILAP